jgi:flavodoxin
MKTLVSYFSASGVTEKIAKKIAHAIEGELFEIEPVTKYTDEDLDWTNKNSRSSQEMNDKEYRPPIKNKIENINDYQTILIGFPIWWFTAPTIINTFIEENNLENKNILLFCTSGGSSIDKCITNLQEKYPTLNILKGKRFLGNETDDQIKEWIK